MKTDNLTTAQLIELMKREGDRLVDLIHVEGTEPIELRCTFSKEGATVSELAAIDANCPDDVREFWHAARFARLFEDATYGQWGLWLLDPATSADATRRFRDSRSADYAVGDLVLGEFLGDAELLVVRTDIAARDFGSVLIASPIEARNYWDVAATSFQAFLAQYVAGRGGKFWLRIN